jgi:hypothetical protein
MKGYTRISWLDIFLGYDLHLYPNSQKISNHILTYPYISLHIFAYPKISSGANSQMSHSRPWIPFGASRAQWSCLAGGGRQGVWPDVKPAWWCTAGALVTSSLSHSGIRVTMPHHYYHINYDFFFECPLLTINSTVCNSNRSIIVMDLLLHHYCKQAMITTSLLPNQQHYYKITSTTTITSIICSSTGSITATFLPHYSTMLWISESITTHNFHFVLLLTVVLDQLPHHCYFITA